MSKRIQWIDFGKGITMLFVVLGHVSLGLYQSGFFDSHREFLLLLIQMVYVAHMPIFFALSGYFFKAINGISDLKKMVIKKLITLGIPYVAFSIIIFIMKNIGGKSVRKNLSIVNLLNIYKMPIDHLWFIYVLFGIFLYVGVLTIFIKNIDMLLLISFIGYVIVNIYFVHIYIIQRILVWTPLFLLGVKLRNIKTSKNCGIIAFIFYIIYIIFWKSFNFTTQINYSRPGVWGIIFPFSVMLAFAFFSNIEDDSFIFKYFVKYGKISLSIYLLHVPIASVIRILLLKLNINNVYIHLIVGLLLAWYISIFIYNIMHKVKFLDFFLYPIKYLKINF